MFGFKYLLNRDRTRELARGARETPYAVAGAILAVFAVTWWVAVWFGVLWLIVRIGDVGILLYDGAGGDTSALDIVAFPLLIVMVTLVLLWVDVMVRIALEVLFRLAIAVAHFDRSWAVVERSTSWVERKVLREKTVTDLSAMRSRLRPSTQTEQDTAATLASSEYITWIDAEGRRQIAARIDPEGWTHDGYGWTGQDVLLELIDSAKVTALTPAGARS